MKLLSCPWHALWFYAWRMRLLLTSALLFAAFSATACREEGAISVRRLSFDGVEAVDESRLRGALATRQSSRLPWGRKYYFDRGRFDADLKRIEAFYADLCRIADDLAATRPTAVNLSWALERLKQVALKHRDLPVPAITARLEAEARRLWQAVDRPNVMIKVPGTDAGCGALRAP